MDMLSKSAWVMWMIEAAAMAQISSTTGSDDEDEVEVEETPKLRLGRNRAQNVFNTGKVKTLPKWAKKGAIKYVLLYSSCLSLL